MNAQLVTRNFRLKALCVLFAMVMWAGVVYATNPPQTRAFAVHVPQTSALLPARYVLVDPIPDVFVDVSGTREHLDAFDVRSLSIRPDFSVIHGVGRIAIPLHLMLADHNVELLDPPPTVFADVDLLGSASLPIDVVINPPPPFGYVVTSQSVSPKNVTIAGPQHVLGDLQAQVHLDFTNQKTNLDATVPVKVYDAANAVVTAVGVTPPTVHVTVMVNPTSTSRSSAVVPAISGSVAAGHELVGVSVVPSTVVVSGPRDLLNALDSVATAPISLNGLASSATVSVTLAPPAGVTATPTTVVVHLDIVAISPSPTAAPTPAPT